MTRHIGRSMRLGFMCRCPHCGEGRLMEGYSKVTRECRVCGENLSHHRADDAPPYFTIMLVGHLVIPMMLVSEIRWSWPVWIHMVVWLPLMFVMTLWLLPRIKGAIVGLQWANRMHGFSSSTEHVYEP